MGAVPLFADRTVLLVCDWRVRHADGGGPLSRVRRAGGRAGPSGGGWRDEGGGDGGLRYFGE